MMIVLVLVKMERWSVLLHIRDDQTHTAHCTQLCTQHNHSGFNKSKFYNGKYTHTISRGEKDGHTDTRTDKKPEYRKFSTVRLRTSFECLTTGKPPGFSGYAPPHFPRGFKLTDPQRSTKIRGNQFPGKNRQGVLPAWKKEKKKKKKEDC